MAPAARQALLAHREVVQAAQRQDGVLLGARERALGLGAERVERLGHLQQQGMQARVQGRVASPIARGVGLGRPVQVAGFQPPSLGPRPSPPTACLEAILVGDAL